MKPGFFKKTSINFLLDFAGNVLPQEINYANNLAQLEELINPVSTQQLLSALYANNWLYEFLEQADIDHIWEERWKNYSNEEKKPQENISCFELLYGLYLYDVYESNNKNTKVFEKSLELGCFNAIFTKLLSLAQESLTTELLTNIDNQVKTAIDLHKMPACMLAARTYLNVATRNEGNKLSIRCFVKAKEYVAMAAELEKDSSAEIFNVYGTPVWLPIEGLNSLEEFKELIETNIANSQVSPKTCSQEMLYY